MTNENENGEEHHDVVQPAPARDEYQPWDTLQGPAPRPPDAPVESAAAPHGQTAPEASAVAPETAPGVPAAGAVGEPPEPAAAALETEGVSASPEVEERAPGATPAVGDPATAGMEAERVQVLAVAPVPLAPTTAVPVTGAPQGPPPATGPGFLLGAEVAKSARLQQPAFDKQLSLLDQEAALRKKMYLALIVIASVLIAGMIAGAVLGIFI